MKKSTLISIMLLFMIGSLHAQKVALVLSGGGAKGLAHIGVIKALEDHNIPIDYIVGTSMGAIVGAFYSAGYSSDEIEEIVLSKGFQNWVNGRLDDDYNYFFHKKENTSSIFRVGVALDSSLNTTLKTELASDLTLNFALANLLSQAAEVSDYDFDKLFIPYRALASEIFTQNEIVLKEGNLPDAVRASMSVPLLYKPIKIDDQFLFDGGIYNNFPVDIALEEFKPDFVIGSNVSEKVFPEYPYDNDEQLIKTSLFMVLLDKSDTELLGENGLYIEPNLGKVGAVDFQKAPLMIDSGYVATTRAIESLEDRAKVGYADKEQVNAKREAFRAKYKDFVFKKIILTGFTYSQKRYLKSFFKLEKKDSLNFHELKKAYYQIISEEFFHNVYPRIYYDDELEGFVFELFGQRNKNLSIEVGGNISSRSISEIYIGLGYKTFTGPLMEHFLDFYSGRFYQSAEYDTRLYFPGSNFIYLQPQVTLNKWDYINSNDILFDDNPNTILRKIDRKYGVVAGFPMGLKFRGELEGAFINNTYTYSNDDFLNSNDVLDETNLDIWKLGLRISSDNLNRKMYPSSGQKICLKGYYFTGDEHYVPGSTSRLQENTDISKSWVTTSLGIEKYFTLSKSYSFGWQINGVLSSQPFFSNYFSTLAIAPSFDPLYDSKTLFLKNFRSHSFAAGGIKNVFRIKRNIDLRLEGYAFMPFQQIENVDQIPQYGEILQEFYLAGTGVLVYHSPIGPISANVNYYDDPQHKWGVYFSLGYLLFNKESMD